MERLYLKKELQKVKVDPKTNDGWNFDYDFVFKIHMITCSSEDSACMEQVDAVLMALFVNEVQNCKVHENPKTCNIKKTLSSGCLKCEYNLEF